MKLRTSLMALAAGSLVPLLAFAVVVTALLVQHERTTMRREAMGRATSAMSAVDAELRGHVTTLAALAASRSLQTGDLRAFHEEARRVLAARPDWLDIGLATPERHQLLDANRPFGENAAFGDDSAFERVLRTGKPAIGDVGSVPATEVRAIRVGVPVVIDGNVRYVLSAPIKPEAFTRVLRAQQVSDDWVINVVDRNQKFVARIPERPVGSAISENYAAALARAPEGWERGRTLEGRDTYFPYVTSALSGWSLGIAIPVATVEAAMWRTLTLGSGGALLALGLAVLLAWWLGRRIEAPIAALADATAAMGRGEDVHVAESGQIAEIARLHAALREASVAVRQRELLAQREKAALERERQALREADAAKDQFIAMLSHELRNPLAALTSAAEVLKLLRPSDPMAAQACDVLDRQTKQMARLVEDLLDTSRIVSGKANLKPERFDLGAVMGELIDAWRGAGRFVAHQVTLDTIPVIVHADRARMEQILSNLLDNALKHTPAGRAIRVTVAPRDGEAILCVDDDGDGIDGALLPRVFELFAQGSQGADRRRGGLGLGLAIVKRLAELQGATVEATSAGPGKGATFTVRMPAAPEAPRAADAARAPTVEPTHVVPRRILVIEDNDDMREMLRMTLAIEGRDIGAAKDGASGIAAAANLRPDVVLVDIGLPDIDGYEVARRLRVQANGDALRLIALTGYGQAEDLRRAAAAGFDAHLVKPVTQASLEQALVGGLH